MKTGLTLAISTLLLGANLATASVTFNPETVTGFVGKGDVQNAFGWNNASLQTKASQVSFTYESSETYEGVCTWTTGEGKKGQKTHNVNHSKSVAISSTVLSETRKNKQQDVTGFNLTGLTNESETGSAPVVGEPCLGEGAEAVWTSVELTGSVPGGLYVNYGPTSVALQ